MRVLFWFLGWNHWKLKSWISLAQPILFLFPEPAQLQWHLPLLTPRATHLSEPRMLPGICPAKCAGPPPSSRPDHPSTSLNKCAYCPILLWCSVLLMPVSQGFMVPGIPRSSYADTSVPGPEKGPCSSQSPVQIHSPLLAPSYALCFHLLSPAKYLLHLKYLLTHRSPSEGYKLHGKKKEVILSFNYPLAECLTQSRHQLRVDEWLKKIRKYWCLEACQPFFFFLTFLVYSFSVQGESFLTEYGQG